MSVKPARLANVKTAAVKPAAKPASPPPSREARVLEEAFARWQGELLGTLFYLVGNLEDARDAIQDAFIKCWKNHDKLTDVKNLKAWIFRIALNSGRDLRETAWRRRREYLPENEAMLVSHEPLPDELAEQDERLARLRAAVAELRPEEQEVFLMRQNGELTYDEIAEALGIPPGTVKTRMRLALTRLREVLVD